jgi:hypothetical protein
MPLWSVEFVTEDHERIPLDYAGVRVVGPHHYYVVQPWEEGAGPSSINLDINADSPGKAKEQAIALYADIRKEAGLSPGHSLHSDDCQRSRRALSCGSLDLRG